MARRKHMIRIDDRVIGIRYDQQKNELFIGGTRIDIEIMHMVLNEFDVKESIFTLSHLWTVDRQKARGTFHVNVLSYRIGLNKLMESEHVEVKRTKSFRRITR